MLTCRRFYRVTVLGLCLLWPASRLTAQDTDTAASSSPKKAETKKPEAKKAETKKAEAKKTDTRKPVAKKPETRAERVAAERRRAEEERRSSKRKGTEERTREVALRGRKLSRRHVVSRPPSPLSIKLTSAFLASAQLRPMAQQLAGTRSAAAYAGVLSYARSHPGQAAAAAYLALGHASMLDHRYADAVADYSQAKASGDALDDYADYLSAQAEIQGGHPAEAYGLLEGFATRYPDSIFNATAPVQLADAHLLQQDGPGALKVLLPLESTEEAGHVDFRYALGRAYQLEGNTAQAAAVFRDIYRTKPLTLEASQSAMQLQAMGVPLSAAERKSHADALFNAKRYGEASAEYNAIGKNNPELSEGDRNALTIYAAVCDFKLKRLSRREIEKLPETSGDTAAAKLYMLAELSRDEGDEAGHDALIAQMVQQFPTSRWLEEALYSGGNMYLLKHEATQAIWHYAKLVALFPNSIYAPSAHWREAWLNYRQRNYAEAARLMDEQIERYRGGIEVPGALYWRGRIYEEEEHNFGQAENYYRTLSETYADYYYGDLARQRLKVLGKQPEVAPAEALSAVGSAADPSLTGELPENDVHLIKARLLANAALNEYIGPEIQASPTSGEWGALAEAEIFASYGEYTRALQSMKHSEISFYSLPIDDVPTVYWHLLFPKPYWRELVADSGKNGLDPYLVASLIRQESEFNAGAVSPVDALGLMQLMPSVGRSLARHQKIRHFQTKELLDPLVNLQLGTANLKQVLDRFGGQIEYALAAYNAGDTPVRQWLANGNYKDVAEFVESIPYTETREYVQAVLRNREMYRELYPER